MELVANPLPPIETLQNNPAITVDALQKQVEELKAKLAAALPAPVVPMTVEEARAFMATFAGKRGRRPVSFREAEAIVNAAMTDADKAKEKAAAKAAKVEAKVEAKAAKVAKKAARILAALTAKAAAAKVVSDKIAKVFLKASGKYEALEAQVLALTPKAPETPAAE